MKRENRPSLSWFEKFAVAFRGIYLAVRYERSCWVHLSVTLAILAAGAFFQITIVEWSLLTLSATLVWTSELLNTAIERLCERLHPEQDPKLAALLDISAGGVLIAAIGASIIGIILFVPRFWSLFLPA